MGKQCSFSMPPENMAFQMARLFKGLSTVFINIRPVVCMGSDMSISVGLLFLSEFLRQTLHTNGLSSWTDRLVRIA